MSTWSHDIRRTPRRGFSLVEVALALGIVSFAMLSVVALVPIGLHSNHASREEARASGILTALEADLRNTRPTLNSGRSLQFGLMLPYEIDAQGKTQYNSSLTKNTLASTTSTVLAEDEQPVAGGGTAHYRATVVYTRVPSDLADDSRAPIEARLIVNWPPLDNPGLTDLTDLTQVQGFVETYVAFPYPQ